MLKESVMYNWQTIKKFSGFVIYHKKFMWKCKKITRIQKKSNCTNRNQM